MTREVQGETIVVEGLTKHYGSFEALKGIDFRVGAGEIVGFLGPNGAGKTTTMKILTCFMAATDGEATVAGFDVREQSEEVRRRIGYLPENVPLYEEMLVYDYLHFIASVQDVESKRRDDRVREVAGRTGISGVLGKTINELSKGYRQRVGLAQAIIHEPEVIILDEPTTGLDPNQIAEIRDVITAIGREKTIIFSTHILQEVTAVCDRIIIIDEGRLVADGTLQELEQQIAEATPGVIVSYECEYEGEKEQREDTDRIRRKLEQLAGVERVVDVDGRSGERTFRLEGDDSQIRRSVIESQSNDPLALKRLQAVQPTLEDIFRAHTNRQKGDEDGDAKSGDEDPPPTESEEEEEKSEKPTADAGEVSA